MPNKNAGIEREAATHPPVAPIDTHMKVSGLGRPNPNLKLARADANEVDLPHTPTGQAGPPITRGSSGSALGVPSPLPPKLHKGGPVKTDGNYNLKAGEHVLTAPEAEKVRKHAMLVSGLKSLANPGKSAKKKK